MSSQAFTESVVEDAALAWFSDLGYAVGHGPHMAPGEVFAERVSFGEVVLDGWLRAALARLNPAIPEEARVEALCKALRRRLLGRWCRMGRDFVNPLR
ncbi:MAG: hypothetical protein H3C30_09265 [Candidatus Hydrogenedentes bacterium]|nr:hypothetical protein [Candidatus Hydrogenedentota bacterium]